MSTFFYILLQSRFALRGVNRRLVILDRINERSLIIHVVNNWFEEFRGRYRVFLRPVFLKSEPDMPQQCR
jgi:predicted DNA-binding protein (UPF0278 family)